MRKLFCMMALGILTCLTLNAQDMIVTQKGQCIMAYGLDIGNASVYYKLNNTPDSPIQSMLKSDILVIKFQDGTTRMFDAKSASASSDVPASESQPVTEVKEQEKIDMDRSDPFANKECLIRYSVIKGKVPAEYLSKKADAGLLHFAPTMKSVLRTKDIEVHYELRDSDPRCSHIKFYDPKVNAFPRAWTTSSILVSVENVSDRVIYLDLGNSFYKIGEVAFPYYVQGAYTTSAGSSGGASVNLGGVANALGVGGVVGAVAGAVTVGGGNSQTAGTIVYNQRILAIPPHSKRELSFMPLFPNESLSAWGDVIKRMTAWGILLNPPYKVPTVGSTKSYGYISTMPNWSTYITYGFSEDKASEVPVQATFYMKSIYGFRQFWTCMSNLECFEPYKNAVVIPCNNYLH